MTSLIGEIPVTGLAPPGGPQNWCRTATLSHGKWPASKAEGRRGQFANSAAFMIDPAGCSDRPLGPPSGILVREPRPASLDDARRASSCADLFP
jgi:hypothetical protein